MSLVCKLYDSAGTTLIKTIDCHRIEIDADRNRSVRRTATFRCPKTYLQDLKTLGRLVRIYDSGQGDGYQGWESVVAAEMNNDDLDSWTVSGGSGTVTYVDDTGCSYWKKARFTGYKWFTYPTDITFDPTALYRLTTRFEIWVASTISQPPGRRRPRMVRGRLTPDTCAELVHRPDRDM